MLRSIVDQLRHSAAEPLVLVELWLLRLDGLLHQIRQLLLSGLPLPLLAMEELVDGIFVFSLKDVVHILRILDNQAHQATILDVIFLSDDLLDELLLHIDSLLIFTTLVQFLLDMGLLVQSKLLDLALHLLVLRVLLLQIELILEIHLDQISLVFLVELLALKSQMPTAVAQVASSVDRVVTVSIKILLDTLNSLQSFSVHLSHLEDVGCHQNVDMGKVPYLGRETPRHVPKHANFTYKLVLLQVFDVGMRCLMEHGYFAINDVVEALCLVLLHENEVVNDIGGRYEQLGHLTEELYAKGLEYPHCTNYSASKGQLQPLAESFVQ